VPEQRAAERRVRFELQTLASLGGELELPSGPLLPGARLVAQLRRRERGKLLRICGMNGDELALQVRAELADDQTCVGKLA
jgi:hypothetical protein